MDLTILKNKIYIVAGVVLLVSSAISAGVVGYYLAKGKYKTELLEYKSTIKEEKIKEYKNMIDSYNAAIVQVGLIIRERDKLQSEAQTKYRSLYAKYSAIIDNSKEISTSCDIDPERSTLLMRAGAEANQ